MQRVKMHALAWLLIGGLILLTACGGAMPRKDLELQRVVDTINEMREAGVVPQLAPAQFRSAHAAVQEATQASSRNQAHLVHIAEQRVAIAQAAADRAAALEELEALEDERDNLRLVAREKEAEVARLDAERARLQSLARAEEADRARREATEAQAREREMAAAMEQAQREASQAKRLAEAQAEEAELARMEADAASAAAATLRKQLENLQARETDRGMVVTLGDVLFESGQAELVPDALLNLDRVVDILDEHAGKPVRIEGHTDSRGSETFNLSLSERRAEEVRRALVNLGVSAERLTAVGLGESRPVSPNETESGRQQNRRVDIVILDQ